MATKEKRWMEEDAEIDLVELALAVLAHWRLIVICTLLAAIAGFGYVKMTRVPLYSASVNLIVNSRQERSGNMTYDEINSSQNLVPTCAIILKSDMVLDEVISELGLDMDYRALSSRISVGAVNETQVMRVSILDPNPAEAKRIIEKIAEIAPEELKDALEAGSCKVISKVAVSDGPVSPNKKKYTAAAALAGMMLAVGYAVLKYLMENTVHDDADVAKYLELPVLGVIPEIEEGKGNGKKK